MSGYDGKYATVGVFMPQETRQMLQMKVWFCFYILLLFSCYILSDSATPWIAARQASLSFTVSQSLLKLMSIESVMLSNHLVLYCLLLLPLIFPSIRVFSNELTVCIMWPKVLELKLQEMIIPDHLTCLLRNLYAGQEATVRTAHGTTDWFQTGKGVHQGCILSPCSFNLYAEYIMRNARLEEAQAGIKIAGRNINNLRYADDTTLMAESEEELKSLLMKVKEESKKVGLKPNIQKTKIMASGPINSWQIDGETVADFIFGGSKMNCRW